MTQLLLKKLIYVEDKYIKSVNKHIIIPWPTFMYIKDKGIKVTYTREDK